MVLRALLTIWFLSTSVLGPVLCCCSPSSVWKASRVSAAASVKPASLPAAPEGGCSHCKDKSTKQSPPADQKPSDLPQPCPGQCPCQDHSFSKTLADGSEQGNRALAQSNWFPLAPAFDSLYTAYRITPDTQALRASNHTGPPPLSGVDRLHLLHVLVC